uniref:Uncharacterized protein n=1 Tax=viral metagenome TaxID=1070528 RepID=A0A6M3M811_9ZZZZ
MTKGEQQIWAAVFSREFNLWPIPDRLALPDGHSRPVVGDPGQRGEWGKSVASSAAEAACCAVLAAREILAEVKEGHGEDSDTYLMLLEMVTRGEAGCGALERVADAVFWGGLLTTMFALWDGRNLPRHLGFGVFAATE